MENFDVVIIGAGIYGLYSALYCAKKKLKVLVLESEDSAFQRATFINQARVHMGYHYPRSFSTAIKSANYFNRFVRDYDFCIYKDFKQIYATSETHSWTNAEQFKQFCKAANIRCEEVSPTKYFKEGYCDGAFLTEEYTYDAKLLKKYFVESLSHFSNVEIRYQSKILNIIKQSDSFFFDIGKQKPLYSPVVINASYASVNQIQTLLGFENFNIKYELCEIILCQVNSLLEKVGLTVMDGPFFSIMPFGKTGFHSLTSVTFTPHMSCKDYLPSFTCQKSSNGYCNEFSLGNCNNCIAKPETAWPYMSNLARKYLKEELDFSYKESYFSMKPILLASEIDDSRPTVIKTLSTNPTFVSVLSGKINTIYDLDSVLSNLY